MEKTINRIRKFRKDREWEQFHTPSNLSKAISIEAAELLEEFLWDNENYNKQNVEEELADVGIQPNTIRLSIGTEHIDDIIDDLSLGFEKIEKVIR